ncbi:uncharacterized protein EDB91DRAFT_1028460, partial [Suillus paluster]|uniref:uncharacterized protein n=1 Tax=Suillus paluster TaxID=48578 RepID=UPI001B879D14
CSTHATRPWDQNRDYQWTLDEEAACCQAPVDPPAPHEDTSASDEHLDGQPEPPDASHATFNAIDPDDIYFAGAAAMGPSKDNLPKTLPEAFIRPDGGLWK